MRIRFLGLLLAALPAVAGSRVFEPPVALYTTFQQKPPAAVVEAMQDEFGNIVASSGLHFEWRTLAGVTGSEISSQLAVLTFKGRCDTDGLGFTDGAEGPLGWTHITDNVILPFADIDCGRIRRFLQRDLLYFPRPEREHIFGRALARVVAHEIYHIFARTSEHASNGICKAAFGERELVSDRFQLDLQNMAELKRALGRASGAVSGGTQ